jgi:hypothetical protein
MTAHHFGKSLKFSHDQADAPWWQEVYRQAFPDMVAAHDLRHDGWHQRAGRDRAIVLSTGRSIYIDEKVRKEAYTDIAIEVWSTYPLGGSKPYPPHPRAVPGWGVKPLDCDFIAYAFRPLQTCYLFPFLGIRAAWEKHGAMWRGKATGEENGYRWVKAPNDGYLSISIAIPIRILQECVSDALTICWSNIEPAEDWP